MKTTARMLIATLIMAAATAEAQPQYTGQWLASGAVAIHLFSLQAASSVGGERGTVAGVLRTASGNPAARVRVAAVARTSEDGLKDAVLVSLAQTDEAGRFRLENVPPGDYYIAAGPVDLSTYYPGTVDLSKRTAVSIAAGASLTGIDFLLQDASSIQARGGRQTINPKVISSLEALQAGIQSTRGSNPPQGGGGRGPLPGNTIRDRSGSGVIIPQSNVAWWTNTALVQRLGLTDDQKKKIQEIFDRYRESMFDLRVDLEKEEALLVPMLAAESPEATKILPQVDRIVQIRGEMEKTYARMTLEMRQRLTRSQWIQLQQFQSGLQIDANPPFKTGP